MGGTADIPILQDFASGGVGMGGAGVGMASRYLSAMQGFLCAHVAGGLFKNLTAIVGCTVVSRSQRKLLTCRWSFAGLHTDCRCTNDAKLHG